MLDHWDQALAIGIDCIFVCYMKVKLLFDIRVVSLILIFLINFLAHYILIEQVILLIDPGLLMERDHRHLTIEGEKRATTEELRKRWHQSKKLLMTRMS